MTISVFFPIRIVSPFLNKNYLETWVFKNILEKKYLFALISKKVDASKLAKSVIPPALSTTSVIFSFGPSMTYHQALIIPLNRLQFCIDN